MEPNALITGKAFLAAIGAVLTICLGAYLEVYWFAPYRRKVRYFLTEVITKFKNRRSINLYTVYHTRAIKRANIQLVTRRKWTRGLRFGEVDRHSSDENHTGQTYLYFTKMPVGPYDSELFKEGKLWKDLVPKPKKNSTSYEKGNPKSIYRILAPEHTCCITVFNTDSVHYDEPHSLFSELPTDCTWKYFLVTLWDTVALVDSRYSVAETLPAVQIFLQGEKISIKNQKLQQAIFPLPSLLSTDQQYRVHITISIYAYSYLDRKYPGVFNISPKHEMVPILDIRYTTGTFSNLEERDRTTNVADIDEYTSGFQHREKAMYTSLRDNDTSRDYSLRNQLLEVCDYDLIGRWGKVFTSPGALYTYRIGEHYKWINGTLENAVTEVSLTVAYFQHLTNPLLAEAENSLYADSLKRKIRMYKRCTREISNRDFPISYAYSECAKDVKELLNRLTNVSAEEYPLVYTLLSEQAIDIRRKVAMNFSMYTRDEYAIPYINPNTAFLEDINTLPL